jgi:uncharacterized protein
MTTSLQPLSANNRDASLDILRGFALAGVLITFCAGDIGSPAGYVNSIPDEIITWIKWILVENRMYTMLIIIFGIGFHVQLEKAKKKGVSLVPFFSRRLLGLLIIGFLHAIFLSTRDILMFYALAGIVLLLVHRLSNRLLVALMLILFFAEAPAVRYLFPRVWPEIGALSQPNNYIDHVQHNWQFFKLYHQGYVIYIEMFVHFLFGFWISRTGLLQKIKTNKKLRRSLLFISLAGAAIFIPGFYFWLLKPTTVLFGKITNPWLQLLISIGFRSIWQIWMLVSVTLYGTILIGLSVSDKTKRYLNPLAAFGQMALSNYLIQSLVLVPYLLVFDKYNNLPSFNGFIVFLIVLALQLLFSAWWMTRYKMGPFEWLLRSFTYWKWQQIKKPSTESVDQNKELINVPTTAYL